MLISRTPLLINSLNTLFQIMSNKKLSNIAVVIILVWHVFSLYALPELVKDTLYIDITALIIIFIAIILILRRGFLRKEDL